ncbi:MAG TPA: nuclear transport factor 2 family protein [Gemmatimonadaceae bacterium]
MRQLAVVLLAASIATRGAAQSLPSSADSAILVARDLVWRAWYNNDTTTLRRLVPRAAAALSPEGWSDRPGILASMADAAKGRMRLSDLRFDNTRISRAGNSALVESEYRVILANGARRDTTRGHAEELFVLADGAWMNPYWRVGPSSGVRAGQIVTLPDTTGANFAIGDSAAMLGTPTDYDAFIGTWQFRFQSRQADGGFRAPFNGHWTFSKMPGGGIIEDHWRADDPSTPMGESLYTYRVYDPQRKVWQMMGSSSKGGRVQPGLTWSDGVNRLAIQHNGDGIVRIRYQSISADHFLWRMDYSGDGGKSWAADVNIMEAWRVGR